MCSRIDLQTHASSALDNPVTLTFDLLTSVNACLGPAVDCMSTNFGVDRFSCFRSSVQTDKHTHTVTDATNPLPTFQLLLA